MGSYYSKPAVKSPSAAYGRLRIDSPHLKRRRTGSHPQGLQTVNSWTHLLTPPVRSGAALTEIRSTETVTLTQFKTLESLPSSDVSSVVSSPPVLVWIGPALICALAYALYNIFIKKSSASMHPVLGGVLLQIVAAALGSLLLGFLIWREDGHMEEFHFDAAGIQWSMLAGAAVGTAEILSFTVSGMGVQAMQSIPIIIGGSVLFGTTLGFVLLREALSYRGWVGVVFIAAGIALVGLDPGAAPSSK